MAGARVTGVQMKMRGTWLLLPVLAALIAGLLYVIGLADRWAVQAVNQEARRGGFVYRQGDRLYVHDAPFRFVGVNSFALLGCAGEDNATPAQVQAMFRNLPPDGVLRFIAGPQVPLQEIESVLSAARATGRRVIWTLTDANGYCGDTRKDSAWYAGGYRDDYFAWLTRVVIRYRHDPVIAMWELINEPVADDVAQLARFLQDAGSLIHRLDGYHLVSSGALPAWAYGGLAGYLRLHAGDGIDVLSMHEYDQVSAMSHHARSVLAAAAVLGKPVLVGEVGINGSREGSEVFKGKNGSRCLDFTARANLLKAKLDAYFAEPAVAGVLYWSFFPTPRQQDVCRYETYPGDPMLELLSR